MHNNLKLTPRNLILLFIVLKNVNSIRKMEGPLGMGYQDVTTCEEFSKFARFNPYSVLDGPWKAFFFWARNRWNMEFDFKVPTKENLTNFKDILKPYLKKENHIEWDNVKLYSYLPHPTLFVEKDDRGTYDFYDLPLKGTFQDFSVEPLKVIMKQKGKYIGLMFCEGSQAFALARKREMPRKHEVQEAASEIGFRARGGKSYLYQGNDWMPVGDAHEEDVYGPGMKFL